MDLIATTAPGKIRGAVDDGILSFKGVPYAASPVGRRYLPPVPPAPWRGVRDALEFGPWALQDQDAPLNELTSLMSFDGLDRRRGIPSIGEDCLYLNVWTPALRDGGKRPIMVWLHGGFFTRGSATRSTQDGARLSKRGDVVVVSVNHRLGGLGYLYLPGQEKTAYADAGNLGMLDIVRALEWVRDHAAEFGGDSGNVTVFGESGGGFKASTLLAMPKAKGLFHKAIVQSGSYLAVRTPEEAAQATQQVMELLGLKVDQVDELCRIDPVSIVAAVSKSRVPIGPVMDGRSILRHPFAPDAHPLAKDIPMLIGVTKTEMSGMTFDPSEFTMPEDRLLPHLKAQVGPSRPDLDLETALAKLRRIFPFASPAFLYFRIATWASFRNNAVIQTERKVAQGGAPAFSYVLEWETPNFDGKYWTPHAIDVPLMFDNAAAVPSVVGAGAQVQVVADAMSTAWISFARTGNPGWAPYDLENRRTMLFDRTSKVVIDPDKEERVMFVNAERTSSF